MKGLISVAQAAEVIGVSRNTGYRMAREGTMPGLVALPRRQKRVKSGVLVAWLAER